MKKTNLSDHISIKEISKKIICGILTFTITILPFPKVVWADNNDDTQRFNQAAGQGTSTARQLRDEFLNDNTHEGNSLSFRGVQVNGSDLFPDTTLTDTSKLYPDSTYSEEQLKSLNDDEALKKSGLSYQSALYEDASSATPSATGSAYKILAETRKNKSSQDLSNDSIGDTARKVFALIDEDDTFGGQFPDCEKLAKITSEASTVHVPDYRVCDKLVDRSADCTLTHTLGIPDIITTNENSKNSINIRPCPDDEMCFETWVGEEYTDNGDDCKEYVDWVTLNVVHPEAITKVILSNVAWDDYFALWINFNGEDHLLYNTTGTLPVKVNTSVLGTSNQEAKNRVASGETIYVDRLNNDAIVDSPRCENRGEDCYYNRCNSGSSIAVPSTRDGVDLTTLFTSVSTEQPITMKSITSTADDGRYHAKLKVYYDPSKITIQDDYTSESCFQAAIAIDENMNEGTYTCTKAVNELELSELEESDNVCVYINGIRICESNIESPLKNLSPLCAEATVKSKTVYWQEEDDDSDVQLNQCDKYEGVCDWISETCIDDAKGELTGNCYVYEETYDCGKNTDYNKSVAKTEYSCDGEIRCMGTDCVSGTYELSDSFGKVSALLNAAEMMGQDMQCTGLDKEGNTTGDVDVVCYVFSGQHKECHQAMKGLGGLEVDCCENPGGIDISQYISMVMSLPKLDTAIMSMENGSMVKGAYEVIRTPIADTLDAVGNYISDIMQPFTSWVENVTGMEGLFSDSSESIMDFITDKIKQKAKEFLTELLQDSAGNTAGEAAAAGGTSTGVKEGTEKAAEQAGAIVDGIGTALTVVGYVYMAYQIACMLSQMIFACEDDELALAAQKEMKNCTYIGQYCSKKVLKTCVQKAFSYCCFSSPLGRIINEQIKEQLDKPMRSMDPKDPNCYGITIEELEEVDWDKIDLSEWTGILIETNNYQEQQDINLDTLTGSGSVFNIDYASEEGSEITNERHNTLERTINRLEDVNLQEVGRTVNDATEVDVTGKKAQ